MRVGQETVETTDVNECIGAITGEVSLSGVQFDIPLDSDLCTTARKHPVSTRQHTPGSTSEKTMMHLAPARHPSLKAHVDHQDNPSKHRSSQGRSYKFKNRC
ncbi:ventricular zone-expressed PH domain-containing protein isoform X7 [Scomber scombrus]|uniref:Ventricular zone-expressed PH domain-containing protein isoform X7 n=1 Tax=Scomber scombrus TaxID=13677 RepID=A0AAV1NS25_SCOSC